MSLAVDSGEYGLKVGDPSVKSIGALAFGPDGILFVADNTGAAIFALDIGDARPAGKATPVDVEKLDTRLAAYLGCAREDVYIRDMTVRPSSQDVYLSVTRGTGAAAIPVLVKVGADGTLSEVPLKGIAFSQTPIEKAPAPDDGRKDVRVVLGTREGEEWTSGSGMRLVREPLRTIVVTDMAYVDDLLLVAGTSNEEFSSTLRRIPFPFDQEMAMNSLEIYHVSHSKYETAAPIRTFVAYGGNTSVLASYTCTPVVHFDLEDVKTGSQLKGRTVAELGSGNTPLDMVSYKSGGAEYLLVSNARYPVMKFAAKDVDKQEALTQPKEPVGIPRTNLPQEGVSKMANLNGGYVLMMQQDEAANISLHSYSIASL